MNLKDIIIAYLTEHGFDGLCREQCGCAIANLMCCGADTYIADCEPGNFMSSEYGEDGWYIGIPKNKADI